MEVGLVYRRVCITVRQHSHVQLRKHGLVRHIELLMEVEFCHQGPSGCWELRMRMQCNAPISFIRPLEFIYFCLYHLLSNDGGKSEVSAETSPV